MIKFGLSATDGYCLVMQSRVDDAYRWAAYARRNGVTSRMIQISAYFESALIKNVK